MFPPRKKLNRIREVEDVLWSNLSSCRLCPRECGVNRYHQKGFCGVGPLPKLSNAILHLGEEPPLVGEKGAGAVFFSGCTMRCVYCQNMGFSQKGVGVEVSVEDLAEFFIILQEEGATTLDLVTPTPHLPFIISALRMALEKGFNLPVVYNTSGYEKLETLALLEGVVDVYLTDARYTDEEASGKYSLTPDYWKVTQKAIIEMHRQVGPFREDRMEGVIVRILVLPNRVVNYKEIFGFLSSLSTSIPVSIMLQYIPHFGAKEFPEINRRVNDDEYEEVLELAFEFGFTEGWYQLKQKRNLSTRGVGKITEKLRILSTKTDKKI